MVTVLEASKCPKCGDQGLTTAPESGPYAKGRAERRFLEGEWWDVVTYYCQNAGCSWYNTGWLVSSNARGEVFERSQGPRGQDKTFTRLSPDAIARGRRMVEDIMNEDVRDTRG